MRFIEAKKIERIIDALALMTMEGECTWTSVDVLDINSEILDKEHLKSALRDASATTRKNIRKDIEFLALKGMKQKKIEAQIASKRLKVLELNKRIKFVEKTQARLKNRIEGFNPKESSGWYIDFVIEDPLRRKKEYPLRLIIRRRELDEGYTYEGGITFAAKADTAVAIDNIVDSGEYPVIYTLGILLKKEGRVNKKPTKVYTLELTGV